MAGDRAAADGSTANCIACHGVHARGVDGLGISLVDSEFAGSATPEDLAAVAGDLVTLHR